MEDEIGYGVNDVGINDLAAVNRLLSQSALFADNIDFSWILDAFKYGHDIYSARSVSPYALKENDRGVIISLVKLIPVELEDNFERFYCKAEALVTDVRFRRRGIGTEIMALAIQRARILGALWVEAEVNCRDFPSIAFFESLGFECISKCPEILMMRFDFQKR